MARHPATPRIPTHPPRATRRRRANTARNEHDLGGERGSVSAELVIATPLLLLMLLAVVQFGCWSHATHIAQAAAARGLAAARTETATHTDGTTAAERLLDQLGTGLLTHPTIHCDRGTTAVSVRIDASTVTVIPFLHLEVHAEADGPIEHFSPVGDRFMNSEGSVAGNPSGGDR